MSDINYGEPRKMLKSLLLAKYLLKDNLFVSIEDMTQLNRVIDLVVASTETDKEDVPQEGEKTGTNVGLFTEAVCVSDFTIETILSTRPDIDKNHLARLMEDGGMWLIINHTVPGDYCFMTASGFNEMYEYVGDTNSDYEFGRVRLKMDGTRTLRDALKKNSRSVKDSGYLSNDMQ